ncbi:MAG: hypothetical protein NWR65_06095, partial [Saprospiraceae bacterium]|nr:hypothetical protein [Saprospiraceae bacterium]
MIFDELPEFKKDLKILSKKFRTLYEDLIVVKKVLEILPHERSPFSFRIDNLGLKKRASQSFKVSPPNCNPTLPSLKKQVCVSNYQKQLNSFRRSVLDSLVKTLQLEASTQTKNST